MTSLSTCAARIREFDNDRFLCTLFAPESARKDLFTLYAFNLELAKIRETVSEPLIGRMRLQFWRDAIPAICAGTPPAHDVAQPLSDLVRRHGIEAAHLHALIDAREADLDDVPVPHMDAMSAYGEATSSRLIAVAFRLLDTDPVRHLDFIRDAGIAIALVGAARAIPYQASTGRVTVPADICAAVGLSVADPHQWPADTDYAVLAAPLLDTAAGHIDAARRVRPRPPRQTMAAMLPLSLADFYLKRLRTLGGDPRRLAARPPGMARHMTLLRRAAIGRA